MAKSTINTYLKFSKTSFETAAKLCRIKDYPDLFGAPELIETTDLEDGSQTFVPGVKSVNNLEFSANYDWDVYKTMVANEGEAGYFVLCFGDEDGKDGKFTWQGSYSLGLKGGSTNAVREMSVTSIPSTAIEAATE